VLPSITFRPTAGAKAGALLVRTDASHPSAESEAMKHRSVRDFLAQLSPAARAEVGGRVLARLLGKMAR